MALAYGDRVDYLAEIADREAASLFEIHVGDHAAIGFKFSQILIGLPMWTWNGEFCVYSEDRYMVIQEVRAKQLAGSGAGNVRPPFFYRYPLGLVCLALLIVVGPPALVIRKRYLAEQQRRADAAFAASFVEASTPRERSGTILKMD